MIRQSTLLWHSIRHTRTSQLLARAKLLAKRRFMVYAARRAGWLFGAHPLSVPAISETLLLAEELPRPLFKRRHLLLADENGRLFLNLLNRRFPLEIPYRWHDPALEYGTRLEKLHLHYMEYLAEADDEHFIRLIEDWVAQNRPYHPGYWLDCWNSYALSIRTVVWMQQYALRQARLPKHTAALLLASLAEQLRFLQHNLEQDIRGNHLIKNIKALLWAGRFFRGEEARRWRRLGERILRQELAEQILPDGMHYERSPAYHNAVFADLVECLHVLEAGETRDALEKALVPAAQVVADLSHPDGHPSLFADGGLHMTYGPDECLQAYGRLTGDRVCFSGHIRLPSAGYYGFRQGDAYFLANYGKIGPDYLPAHAHGDIFSFEWDVRGQRVIVDAGVYEYHPGRWRNYARSTAAHNTVTIDDSDQCEFWNAFRVGRRATVRMEQCRWDSARLTLEGYHDGYGRLPGAPIHRRRIVADAQRLQVTDWVERGRGQAVRARLLCHPACHVSQEGGIIGISGGSARANLYAHCPVRIDRACWLPDFGKAVKTYQITVDYGPAPCQGGFCLEMV